MDVKGVSIFYQFKLYLVKFYLIQDDGPRVTSPIWVVACLAEQNCKTCSGLDGCSTCDTTAFYPRFMRTSDDWCVLKTECDESSTYVWNEDNNRCESKIHHKSVNAIDTI